MREELGFWWRSGGRWQPSGGGYGEVTILFEAHGLDDAELHLSDEIERVGFFFPAELPPMPEIVRSYILEAVAALGKDGPSRPGESE